MSERHALARSLRFVSALQLLRKFQNEVHLIPVRHFVCFADLSEDIEENAKPHQSRPPHELAAVLVKAGYRFARYAEEARQVFAQNPVIGRPRSKLYLRAADQRSTGRFHGPGQHANGVPPGPHAFTGRRR